MSSRRAPRGDDGSDDPTGAGEEKVRAEEDVRVEVHTEEDIRGEEEIHVGTEAPKRASMIDRAARRFSEHFDRGKEDSSFDVSESEGKQVRRWSGLLGSLMGPLDSIKEEDDVLSLSSNRLSQMLWFDVSGVVSRRYLSLNPEEGMPWRKLIILACVSTVLPLLPLLLRKEQSAAPGGWSGPNELEVRGNAGMEGMLRVLPGGAGTDLRAGCLLCSVGGGL